MVFAPRICTQFVMNGEITGSIVEGVLLCSFLICSKAWIHNSNFFPWWSLPWLGDWAAYLVAFLSFIRAPTLWQTLPCLTCLCPLKFFLDLFKCDDTDDVKAFCWIIIWALTSLSVLWCSAAQYVTRFYFFFHDLLLWRSWHPLLAHDETNL